MFWPVQVFDENLEFWHFVRIRISFLQLHVFVIFKNQSIRASEHQSIRASGHQSIRASNFRLYLIIFDYIRLYSIIFDYIRLYSIVRSYIYRRLGGSIGCRGIWSMRPFAWPHRSNALKKRLGGSIGCRAQSRHKVGTKSAQSRPFLLRKGLCTKNRISKNLKIEFLIN